MVADYNWNELYETSTTTFTTDLVDEIIQQYGIPCYYLPRENVNLDEIFGQDDLSKYESAFSLYLLPENPGFYNGGGDLFGKFGFQAMDTMTMYVEINRFQTTTSETTPLEDDLIYIPVSNSWFQVSFTDDEGAAEGQNFFYANGVLSAFKIEIQKYQYGHETITASAVASYIPDNENQTNTDNDAIDEFEKENTLIDDFDDILDENL